MDFNSLEFLNHEDSRGIQSSSLGVGAASTFGSSGITDKRTDLDKHIDVVTYLKKLKSSKSASDVDIARDVGVFLDEKDVAVLSMIKQNPHVDIIQPTDGGETTYRFHTKVDITNKHELIALINRSQSGVLKSDLLDCYEGVDVDIQTMTVSGDILSVPTTNPTTKLKDIVIFGRGQPFLVELSGTMRAFSRQSYLQTEQSVKAEIRRGDAIWVRSHGQGEGEWFRVDCSLRVNGKQPEVGTAPLTVSSLEERAKKRRDFAVDFNDRQVPLDAEFNGDSEDEDDEAEGMPCRAFKHGCTNDIREMWGETNTMVKRRYMDKLGNDSSLSLELKRLGLISTVNALAAGSARAAHKGSNNKKRPRAARKSKASLQSSAHLKGTKVGAILDQLRNQMQS